MQPEYARGRYLSSRFSLFGPAEKVLQRWNIQALPLLLALVGGLTWIRKRTIVVARRSLPETPNRTAQGLAVVDALKDEPIDHAALTWEAAAPPEGLRTMVKRSERLCDNGGSRLDAIGFEAVGHIGQ